MNDSHGTTIGLMYAPQSIYCGASQSRRTAPTYLQIHLHLLHLPTAPKDGTTPGGDGGRPDNHVSGKRPDLGGHSAIMVSS